MRRRFFSWLAAAALSACGGSGGEEPPTDEAEDDGPLLLDECRGASAQSCNRAENCTAAYGWDGTDGTDGYQYAGCSTGAPTTCEVKRVCAQPTESYPCLVFETACIPDGWFEMPCSGACPTPPSE